MVVAATHLLQKDVTEELDPHIDGNVSKCGPHQAFIWNGTQFSCSRVVKQKIHCVLLCLQHPQGLVAGSLLQAITHALLSGQEELGDLTGSVDHLDGGLRAKRAYFGGEDLDESHCHLLVNLQKGDQLSLGPAPVERGNQGIPLP